MSFQAVTWAIDQKTGSPSAKAVLWSIANYANDQWCAWPFQETIAEDSEQSTDSVGKRIAELVGAGLMRRIKLKRFGRRTHDFLILARSPLFSAPLEDIRSHIPSGCDVMEDATADSGSVQKLESARAQNESEVNESADCGSVSEPTLPQSAVDATALVREPIEPLTNQDSLPQTPSHAGGEVQGQAKEEVAADTGFEDWFQKFKTTYPIPDSHPERTRDAAVVLTIAQRDLVLTGARGAAEFLRRRPKASIVGQLRFIRSSALWDEYARFAPALIAAPPRPRFIAADSAEFRARQILDLIAGGDVRVPTDIHDHGLGGLTAPGPASPDLLALGLERAGDLTTWCELDSERDAQQVAAWTEKARLWGVRLKTTRIVTDKVLLVLPSGTIVYRCRDVLAVPAPWPPRTDGSWPEICVYATEADLNEFSKTG